MSQDASRLKEELVSIRARGILWSQRLDHAEGFMNLPSRRKKKKQLAALSFCCSSGKFENALCASRGQWPREEPRPHSCPCHRVSKRSTAAAVQKGFLIQEQSGYLEGRYLLFL